MSLLLENSHAMHFQTMPNVHHPILTIGYEERGKFKKKKNMAAHSQAKRFRLHSHSSIHITDLQQKTHSAQTKHKYIY